MSNFNLREYNILFRIRKPLILILVAVALNTINWFTIESALIHFALFLAGAWFALEVIYRLGRIEGGILRPHDPYFIVGPDRFYVMVGLMTSDDQAEVLLVTAESHLAQQQRQDRP